MKYIIKFHSVIDVITNSSTEIYIIDENYGLAAVTELIKEKEKQFPPKFNHYGVNIYLDNPEYCDHGGGYYFDEEEAVKRLIARGYTVIKPEKVVEPRAIIVECEQGYMSSELKKYIEETFNAEIGW